MYQSNESGADEAIFSYAYGMDTGNWDMAVSRVAPWVEIDYSAVGGPKGKMTKSELRSFLEGLLGKVDLRVHTAISQVFPDPQEEGQFIAYYTVRHYRTAAEGTRKFAVFGWYRYRMDAGKISSLGITVSAVEGDPSTLV